MNNYRPFAGITPAVKIIIIINVLVFLAINMIGKRSDVDLFIYLECTCRIPVFPYLPVYHAHVHAGRSYSPFLQYVCGVSCSGGYWNRYGYQTFYYLLFCYRIRRCRTPLAGKLVRSAQYAGTILRIPKYSRCRSLRGIQCVLM